MAREYFKCFHSYREKCKKLSDQELGRLFRALMEYSESGTSPDLTGRESIAFDFIADEIDRDKSAYSDTCRKNRENGAKATERYRPVPNGTERGPEGPKGTQIDKVEGIRTNKETLPNGSAKKAGGAVFHPPTLEQVKAYAKEANLSIDCEKFYAYFTVPNPDTGKTWVDSQGNPVKNWKQKMLTWESKGRPVDRARKNNTLLNYDEKGKSHASVTEIELDLEEL